MHLRIGLVRVVTCLIAVVVARAGAQSAGLENQAACVLQSQRLGNPLNYEPCAPFTMLAVTVIDRIPHELFGQYNDPVALALLSDGSPMSEPARVLSTPVVVVWKSSGGRSALAAAIRPICGLYSVPQTARHLSKTRPPARSEE